jgi:cytochrome c551/c552/cytochrome c5
MCSWRELVALAALLLSGSVLAQGAAYPGVGRAATPKEIAAWDIDVRPDFKGLPAGAGSVAKGQEVWEAQCASCHGIFGESGEVFNPLVGGTSKADVEAGRVARLTDGSYPGRTTLMKLAHVSTLWDYINRAMPWTNPKTLSVEEVYAVTAYLLNMGDIVPGDFVLSDRNIADVQKRLPNRDGMSTRHGLWPGPEFGGSRKPDVQGSACMRDCAAEPRLASFLPEFARDAHGNLAEQNRPVGAQRGVDTSRPSGAPPAAAPPKPAAADDSKAAIALAQKHGCTACHGLDTQLVGPAFREIAKKHAGRADALPYLMNKIKAGGSGVWGSIPMPPQTLPDADAQALAGWLAAGAGKNP